MAQERDRGDCYPPHMNHASRVASVFAALLPLSAAAWDQLPRPFLLVRDYHWPAWAGRDALAVLSSNSGRTEETLSLARETARYGIHVNCVCPGPTDTPLMAAVPDKVKDALVKAIPLRRLARPDEVADAVLFFSGDGASYVTGQVLSVSGGLTMAG